jgi:hypothetical protein
MPVPSTRKPAVAASFYPASAVELESVVEILLADVHPSIGPPPKAIIAPHASYAYSGAVAASAYARVARSRGTIERVVVLGPAHYMPVHGLATSSFDSYATPIGELAVDREANRILEALPFTAREDTAHVLEHSVEVHLPFVIAALGRVRIVPVVVGDASDEDVAHALEDVWGGAETLVVVSSDLSHDVGYADGRRRDEATTRAIEALDPSAIGEDDACGRVAMRGLLVAARRHDLAVETLDLRSSGDTAGDRVDVVGYGAYALA